MAKKKEKKLAYLQMPLPDSRKAYRMNKMSWYGLNYRQTMDTGALSMEKNISTQEAPYLTPSPKMIEDVWYDNLSTEFKPKSVIGIFGVDDILIVIYRAKSRRSEIPEGESQDDIKISYVKNKEFFYTGVIKSNVDTGGKDDYPRSILQFNVYDTPTDPLTGQYVKKLLIFPDKVSMFMNIVQVDTNDNPEGWYDFDKNKIITDKDGNNLLNSKDLDVMYCYEDSGVKKYYTVSSVKLTPSDADYDANKDKYKRELKKKYVMKKEGSNNEYYSINEFRCDGMEVLVKDYKNETPEVDASGAIIYPPPDTASHNCYYRNSYNNDIYRWCEYATAKRLDEWGLDKNLDENENLINKTANKDGFILEGDNYILDGDTEYGWKVAIPPAVPDLKYATVHLSRVFGVDDDRVYASGYNDYMNWNLDTVDEYNESNSWCSPAQSNTKTNSSFTGITTFQNHVICFKQNFMHEIYNNKNPFRIQDIFAEGSIDNRSIQDVDGRLIFVSDDGVKIYTGSNPKDIGYYLGIDKFSNPVSGTDGKNYYLYCEDENENKRLFVYDTFVEHWSERELPIDSKDEKVEILGFAHNKIGMYMLGADKYVYKLDTTSFNHEWSFETDLFTNQTVDIKHIKKVQLFADIAKDAKIKVYILYDDEEFNENSHLVYDSKGKTGKIPIRVKPRQTANYGFKLHFEGTGYVKIYELEILVEAGGDLYV